MKIWFLLLTGLLLPAMVWSQDTICMRNGDRIDAKVEQIDPDYVKYKRFSNPNGPLYVVERQDVAEIRYRNGSADVFSSEENGSSYNSDSDAYDDDRDDKDRTVVRVFVNTLPYFAFQVLTSGWWTGGCRPWFRSGGGHHHGHYGPR